VGTGGGGVLLLLLVSVCTPTPKNQSSLCWSHGPPFFCHTHRGEKASLSFFPHVVCCRLFSEKDKLSFAEVCRVCRGEEEQEWGDKVQEMILLLLLLMSLIIIVIINQQQASWRRVKVWWV
jgi:hypothetical protein